MTVVINNMVKHGWITRCIFPEDRRCSVITITEAGKQLFEAVFPEHLKDLDRFLKVLTEDEKATLISLLKRIGLEQQSNNTNLG